jgi:hypothetical protein
MVRASNDDDDGPGEDFAGGAYCDLACSRARGLDYAWHPAFPFLATISTPDKKEKGIQYPSNLTGGD